MGSHILSCGHEEPADFTLEKNVVEYYSEFETDRSDMENGGGPCFVYKSFCNECLKEKWLKRAINKAKILRSLERGLADAEAGRVSKIKIYKCSACSCGDCREGKTGREYWFCPHFNDDICSICCIYDSTASDMNFDECATCIHDKDREK